MVHIFKNLKKKLVKIISGDFPGGSLEDSTLPMQGMGLIPNQELRSCMPHSATNNNNNFCIFINTLFSKTSCSFTFL